MFIKEQQIPDRCKKIKKETEVQTTKYINTSDISSSSRHNDVIQKL